MNASTVVVFPPQMKQNAILNLGKPQLRHTRSDVGRATSDHRTVLPCGNPLATPQHQASR